MGVLMCTKATSRTIRSTLSCALSHRPHGGCAEPYRHSSTWIQRAATKSKRLVSYRDVIWAREMPSVTSEALISRRSSPAKLHRPRW